MQVEDAERILDELEEIARSGITNQRFFHQVVASLQLLVESRAAMMLARMPQTGWICVAASGTSTDSCVAEFSERVESHGDVGVLETHNAAGSWFACSLQSTSWDRGALLVCFDRIVHTAAASAVMAVVRAFAEVLDVRHTNRVETLFSKNLQAVQQLNQSLASSDSQLQAAGLLVNQLVPLLSAARISLLTTAGDYANPGLLAISGCDSIDRGSQTVRSIHALAKQAIQKNEPMLRQGTHSPKQSNLRKTREDGTFEDVLVLKLTGHDRTYRDDQSLLVIEWESTQELLDAMYAVMHIVPWIATTWRLQNRWQRMPRLLRRYWLVRKPTGSPWLTARLVQTLALATFALVVGWIMLRPVSMVIEAEALLEPTTSRTIFAPTDGFLHHLHVDDGQAVKSGDLLAELRSPTLDMQIEEVVGQIHSIAEKRNGLRIANAQSTGINAEETASQTRISSEILLLETQEKHAREKLEFLHRERGNLTLMAPIAGTVVSRKLKQELESRPLRRGDALFSVMDVAGQWQLNIRVADRDTGYLLKYYDKDEGAIEFVLDSNPSERLPAKVYDVGRVIEDSQGTGGYLQVLASLPNGTPNAHLGATARVTFECGEAPLWFVWCRPAVEAIQKRFWLFTW